jgi:hypothetical protein
VDAPKAGASRPACRALSNNRDATWEVAMKALELAKAYVQLDRFVSFQLQDSSVFQSRCDEVRQRLRKNEGLPDFEKLCDAGAEGDELLWLLAGCDGLPGFTLTLEVFGWSAQELKKGLAAVEKAASVIEKIQCHPFGLLARHAESVLGSSGLEQDLSAYLALARAASDFGHRSKWFLNIAKARLVIHVTHRTKGGPHDSEVSGLVAAMTSTDYNADAQRRWRQKHNDLIRDAQLDPYTTKGQAGRDQVRRSCEEIAAREPEFFQGFTKFVDDYWAVARSRNRKLPNRGTTKNTL